MADSSSDPHGGEYAFIVVDAANVRPLGSGAYEIRVQGIIPRVETEDASGHSGAGPVDPRTGRHFDTFGFLCPNCRAVTAVITGVAVVMNRGATEVKREVPPCAGPSGNENAPEGDSRPGQSDWSGDGG